VRSRLPGALLAGAGLLLLTTVLHPSWRAGDPVTWLLFGAGGENLAPGTAVTTGAALAIIGRGVLRGHRLALHLAAGLLLVATVAHLLDGFHVVAAGLTALAAVLLLWGRAAAEVPVHPARLLAVTRLAVVLAVTGFGYALAELYAHRDLVRPPPTPRAVVSEFAALVAGGAGPLALTDAFGHWFPLSLTWFGLLSAVALLLVALAPASAVDRTATADRASARLLVDRADADTLAPFVLRRDKFLLFAPNRRAVVAFRHVRGVGLASGDPVGDPAAFPDAVREFQEVCARLGRRPAVIGVRFDRIPVYEALGWHTLYIGDEAVLDVASFTLDGRRMRNVRQAVGRTRHRDMTTELLREGDVDAALAEQLGAVATAARAGRPEFGFTMALGDLFAGEYPDSLVAVCRDRDGRAVAFQRYLPCARGAALSLDAMYRRPDTTNGVTERLIVDVVEWGRAHGVSVVSLNFAAFRALLDPSADRSRPREVTARLLHGVDGRLGLQLDTLRRFNAKFAPRWVPRHLAYRSAADLPAIGLAALSAEGFLPLDRGRSTEPAHRDDGVAPARRRAEDG
jgi:lysyl-tRNA synthetase class 2